MRHFLIEIYIVTEGVFEYGIWNFYGNGDLGYGKVILKIEERWSPLKDL
jgi:hypothetical protein